MPRHLAVVALPNAYTSSIGVLVDSFALLARQVQEQFPQPNRRTMKTQVHLLSPAGRALQLAGGRQMACDGDLQGDTIYRAVYVPAFVAGNEAALASMLDRLGPVLAWLRWQRSHGALLAASGSAVLLLAATGLLNGGRAAVPKQWTPLCRRRYPRLLIERRDALVEWNGIHTCAAAASEWSLAVRLVEHSISPLFAQWLAYATGTQPAQDKTSVSGADALVNSAQFWLSQRYAQEHSIEQLAQAMAVSHATLIRHFERSLGMTPRMYVQQLRVTAGKHLLQSTNSSIEQIAVTVGYVDVRSFRAMFQRHTGVSPSGFRQSRAPL